MTEGTKTFCWNKKKYGGESLPGFFSGKPKNQIEIAGKLIPEQENCASSEVTFWRAGCPVLENISKGATRPQTRMCAKQVPAIASG